MLRLRRSAHSPDARAEAVLYSTKDSYSLLEVSWVAQSKAWWPSECLTGRREVHDELQHMMSLLWLGWGGGWRWAARKVCSRGQQLTSTHTPAPTAATPNTHPNNTSSHQTPTGKFWISVGKWIMFSLNVWVHKNKFLILGRGSGLFAVFCFCDVTWIHRCAPEFCAGFKAIKDTLLQKKQRYLFWEFTCIPWSTFKQPTLTRPRDQKVFVDQKTDHDAGFTNQFICLPVWWIFCLPFWGYPNNHNNTLHWGGRHYFRYGSGFLCTGTYKCHFFLWERDRGVGGKLWAISPVLRFSKGLCEPSFQECSWSMFSHVNNILTVYSVIFDENDSGVWNISKQNGSVPKSESQTQIPSFVKLDAGCI